MNRMHSIRLFCLILFLLFSHYSWAQDCASLAKPVETADIGLWYDEVDAERALRVCEAELDAKPNDQAVRAHLARVFGLLDQEAKAAQLLFEIEDPQHADALAYLGIVHKFGYDGQPDYDKAHDFFKQSADKGNLYALGHLATLYLEKDKGPYDPERGRDLRRRAAESGNPLAAEELGVDLMYRDPPNTAAMVEAVRWFNVAAKGRSTRSFSELGRAYRWAKGVDQDDREAVAWWERGTIAGDAYSAHQLGHLYRHGRGVEKDLDQALELYQQAAELGRTSGYHSSAEVLELLDRIAESIEKLREGVEANDAYSLERLGNNYYFGIGVPRDLDEAVRLTTLAAEMGDMDAIQRLADFYNTGIGLPQDPGRAFQLYQRSAKAGRAYSAYMIGLAYRNGNGVDIDLEKGLAYLKEAADGGETRAFVSIGYALANGEGAEVSFEDALQWYLKAAENGSAIAKSNIAEFYENGLGVQMDPSAARDWYRQAAEAGNKTAIKRLADLLIEENNSAALAEAALWLAKATRDGDPEARSMLEAAFADPEQKISGTVKNPSAALQDVFVETAQRLENVRVGCVIILVDCGDMARRFLDLENASKWYRRAGTHAEAQFRLGRLLSAQPHLSKIPEESDTLLLAAATAGLTDAQIWRAMHLNNQMDPQAAADILARELNKLDRADAARLAQNAVTGQFGDQAIGAAWFWLETQEALGNPYARSAMLGATLFLGAFTQTAALLEQIPDDVPIDLVGVDYTLRQTLTFLMYAVREGITPGEEQLDAISSILLGLIKRGDSTADELNQMLSEVRYRLINRDSYRASEAQSTVSAETQLRRLEKRIASKTDASGVFPILVPLFQEKAKLLAELGDRKAAEAAVYQSLAIAKTVNDQVRHLHGSLVYHMEMACNQRKGSDLFFQLGLESAGLVLAKSAVNHLQSARSTLIGLPQELQNCFRDLLSDQYRRMADLLIRNNQLDQAQLVISQLKDLETFQYANKAANRVGAALEPITMSTKESDILTRIHGLPVRELLSLQHKQQLLADTDKAAADAIASELEQANLALADSLDALSEAVDALDSDSSRELAREIRARTLRRLAGRLGQLDDVALVYSVSLPQRTHFLIVSAEGTEHHELSLSDNQLNAKIRALRDAFGNPGTNPLGEARSFYESVWKGVDGALSELPDQSHVLLALDGSLRYVPIGALYGPDGWLMEKYQFTTFTPASRDLLLDDEPIEAFRAEALGASRGGTGFTPLPYVRQELARIAGEESALLDGRIWLDETFDTGALEAALDSGSPIIHIATHFDLTESEASSRLLLGNGKTLSIADLKDGIRRGRYDLADVHLLVLSACRTAIAGGSELESLATEMQYEGVRSVVATLWPVADLSTAQFMEHFYTQLKAKEGRATALRNVQLAFATQTETVQENGPTRGFASERSAVTASLPGTSHPFYWAGFQLIGQWR